MRSPGLPDATPPVVALPDHLRRALLAAQASYDRSLGALRDAVCEHVSDARRQGIPLEETVAEVKALVAELRAAGEIPPAERDGEDPLLAQLLAWCDEFGT